LENVLAGLRENRMEYYMAAGLVQWMVRERVVLKEKIEGNMLEMKWENLWADQ
jgi:hypothetical protein